MHLRRLSLICERNGVTPKKLVNLGRRDRKRFEDMVLHHVTKMELDRKWLGYIAGILKGLKSWLVHNEVELEKRVKMSGQAATSPVEDEID